ncbi:hypothetical protein CNMCM5878_009756 [Aspergillus fumigatiaffinis]|nr:hypothetical protein CNMCM5878_009756 [Aspergillus fumigatiaffinis]
MSRNFIPAALAIGVGILTGYYTFQPALQELQIEKHSRVKLGDQAVGPAEVVPSEKQDNGGIEDRTFSQAQGLRTGSRVLKHVGATWCKTYLPGDRTSQRAFEGPRAAPSRDQTATYMMAWSSPSTGIDGLAFKLCGSTNRHGWQSLMHPI